MSLCADAWLTNIHALPLIPLTPAGRTRSSASDASKIAHHIAHTHMHMMRARVRGMRNLHTNGRSRHRHAHRLALLRWKAGATQDEASCCVFRKPNGHDPMWWHVKLHRIHTLPTTAKLCCHTSGRTHASRDPWRCRHVRNTQEASPRKSCTRERAPLSGRRNFP